METIAHYRILERLGENRIGEIFRARDTRVGRTVALLVPRDDIQNDTVRRSQLLADAQQAIAVSHPNIAALYESGDEGGRIHLAFEFVPGQTLDRVIAGHPLNARRALDLAIQIADALADAHAAGLVHGDLTTQRVVVTPKGNAKVVDFGFARWTSGAGSATEEAVDLNALRVVLFEMLTGKAAAEADVVAPTNVNSSLPPEVDPLVSNAFGSAVVLAAELRAVAAVLETRAESAQKNLRVPRRGPRQSRIPWIALATAAAAVVLAAVWWFLRR